MKPSLLILAPFSLLDWDSSFSKLILKLFFWEGFSILQRNNFDLQQFNFTSQIWENVDKFKNMNRKISQNG